MSFWINNPSILFDSNYITELWPYSSMTRNEKLNAITRFIIAVSLIGYMCINRIIIVIFGLILIGVIVLLYSTQKEGMVPYFEYDKQVNIVSNNPFSNVLITDYHLNKAEFKEDYTPDLENRLNDSIKESIIEQNKDNMDIRDLFKNDSDNFGFEQNARQFYTNPSTTIPNKQDNFLDFCFGNLPCSKTLIIH
jgi:hypothetical protein